MSHLISYPSVIIPKSQIWIEANKTKVIYQCYDCELMPTLITSDFKRVRSHCKANGDTWSEYPIGTYCDE